MIDRKTLLFCHLEGAFGLGIKERVDAILKIMKEENLINEETYNYYKYEYQHGKTIKQINARNKSREKHRLSSIKSAALKLFQSDKKAVNEWLYQKVRVRGFGYIKPVDMTFTYDDTQIVLNLIARLEHGELD